MQEFNLRANFQSNAILGFENSRYAINHFLISNRGDYKKAQFNLSFYLRVEPIPTYVVPDKKERMSLTISIGSKINKVIRSPHGWLANSGISVRRSPPPANPEIDVYELVVHRRSLEVDRPLRILQIGANDGKTMDPVYELIRRYQMDAILVEPIPEVYERLKQNYSDYPAARCINAAIGPSDGHLPLHILRTPNPEPGLDGSLVASFSRKSVKKHLRHFKGTSYIETINVPTKTLDALLGAWSGANYDILQCDLEGYDAEAVRMALSSGNAPKIINFEYVHLDYQARLDISRRLSDASYKLLNHGFDTLAWRP
jgi:FkbM family methyltransferase